MPIYEFHIRHWQNIFEYLLFGLSGIPFVSICSSFHISFSSRFIYLRISIGTAEFPEVIARIRVQIDVTIDSYQSVKRDSDYWNEPRLQHWRVYPVTPISTGKIYIYLSAFVHVCSEDDSKPK